MDENADSEAIATRRRAGNDWLEVLRAATVMVVLSVPTMVVEEDWHGSPMIDQPTHLWVVAAIIVMLGFLLGGILAGYRRPGRAARNTALAASVTVVLLVLAGLARRLFVAHEGTPSAVAELWIAGVVLALALSFVGSQVGRYLAPPA